MKNKVLKAMNDLKADKLIDLKSMLAEQNQYIEGQVRGRMGGNGQ